MTGGRILKASKFLDTNFFFLTYGDGLSNLDIQKSLLNYLKIKVYINLQLFSRSLGLALYQSKEMDWYLNLKRSLLVEKVG